MDSTETRRLLALGEAGAFEAIFAQHREQLATFVDLRLDGELRRRVDASDVVQEAQLDAFRRLPDYLARRPMPFRLWLCKTAYERLLKLRRQHLHAQRRTMRHEQPLPNRSSMQLARRLLSGIGTPSQQVARREMTTKVAECLLQLSEMDGEILIMRSHEDRSYDEIGALLDIEPATARKRYGRALLRLRKLLVDAGVVEATP
jgi:RNA polymerase sigma-70 factor, ECF subfamily